MFNQSANPADYRVELRPRLLGDPTELDGWIAQHCDFKAQPWSDFSTTVSAEVISRCRLLPKIIARGMSYTR
jgi:hypothetical protein